MNGLHDVIAMQEAETRDRIASFHRSEERLTAENLRLKTAMVVAVNMLKVPAAELVPAMGDAWVTLESALGGDVVQVTDDMVQCCAKVWVHLDEENEPVRPDQRRQKYIRAMLAAAFNPTASN